ncbi:PREDICTED: location of vulva defective 1-like [Amphimedon queenslandica]|uniref:Protein kinase domain-containing protein n=1 Tax=Amphimedon queenslandica TaxID=400682 RepID=A0AAN0JQF0_AMPQE|nr:PREDICTED: location of vulva defective 1-like [Amphimedon queenslandica]|eukprot:XP_019859040.1 PREDICTED: location of vulva defective 1-like [Amphimedon queenslandica]
MFPSVQVFRRVGASNNYNLMTERTIFYSTSNVSTSGMFEYPLNPPIPVMSGDLLAVSQPEQGLSTVRLYYIDNVPGVSFSSSQQTFGENSFKLNNLPTTTNQLILVYPVTDGYCVNSANSITPSVIRNNFLTIQSSGDIDQRRQYLYPEIVFSCNGSLTKWIYGGEPVSGNNRNDLPELQIWRQLGPNNYNKIGSSLVNANTMIGTNLYEFIPQTPLQFQEGDIFGVHSPQSTQRLFDLYEQVRNGPLNERVGGNVADPSSTITQALVTDTNNDFPLVTVEVSISVASSVTSSTSTSPVISTTFVMITSTALTAATISTTDNTILSSTVVSITLSSTSSVLVTATPSSSVTTDTPPSISSSISRSDDFNSLLLSLTYSSSSFDTTLVTSSTVIITTAPSDSSVIATTATSTAPSSTSVMTNTHSSSSSMTDTTSTSVATSAFSSTSMMTNTPSSSLSMTDTTPTSVTTSAPSSTSMMTNTPSSSLSMTDTTPTSVTTSAPSSTSLMTSTPPNSSSATIPPNTVSATSTGSTASSSSSVITGATTPSSSSTDSITSSSHAVTSSPTASPSVISNPSAGSGASTVIAVVISILVLFIATSVGIIIVLLLVMKKRKKRYTDRVTLLTASFSASSTLRSEGGYTINNVVYDDVDKLSGPVTYDHYETAPDVPQRGSTVSNPLYSDTNMQQKTSTISNPLYGDKSFEAAAVETAYETLITDKKSSPVDDIKVEGHLPDDQINIYDELNNQSALPSAKSNEEPHYWAPGDDTSSIYQQMESKGYKQLKGNDIKISNELGSGEFGTVYEGTWFSKPVAIKTLKNSSEEQDKVKFLQEAAIMGQFHHPNIVKLHGMVTVGDQYFQDIMNKVSVLLSFGELTIFHYAHCS